MKQGNSTYDQRLTGQMFFTVLESQPRFARKISNVPDEQFCRARNYGVQCLPKFNFWIFLVFLAFDVVVLRFVPTSAIEHASFQFLYSNCRFETVRLPIQLCSLEDSTFKFTQFSQHPSLRNSTFNFRSNLVPRVLSLPRESTLVTAGHVSARF